MIISDFVSCLQNYKFLLLAAKSLFLSLWILFVLFIWTSAIAIATNWLSEAPESAEIASAGAR